MGGDLNRKEGDNTGFVRCVVGIWLKLRVELVKGDFVLSVGGGKVVRGGGNLSHCEFLIK